MKHFKLLSFLLLLTLAGSAQIKPCPTIVSSALVPLSGSPDCTATVFVTASGDVPPQKGLRIIVHLGADTSGAVLADTCFTVEGNSPATRFETSPFSYPCGATLTYQIIRYTASNGKCSGGECGPRIISTGPSGGPLPIKLSSFYGNRKSNSVQLEWTSAQEANASYYEVERNTGAGFHAINKINAKNSALGSKYSFEDINASKSAVQYRLKLVDADGSFTLSNVVSIKSVSSVSNVDIYPNPAVVGNAKIKISDITDITNVQVYDLSGKLIKNINVTNNDINMSDLKAGSYLLKMINAKTGGTAAKRFIILN